MSAAREARQSGEGVLPGYRVARDVHVDGQLTVLGDLHGKIATLEAILTERRIEEGLAEHAHTLVSVGDLVDRGPRHQERDRWVHDGVERLIDRVLGLRARFPDRVHVIAGNHEMAHLIDIADHALGPDDVSRWPGQGELQLTPQRLAFLLDLPIALRLSVADTRALVVHAGVPLDPIALDGLGNFSGAVAAHAHPAVRAMLWANPTWSNRAVVTPVVYSETHIREFLAANGATVLIRGHRDEMEIRPIGDSFTYICVHSAQGDERRDVAADGYAYLAWDPPDGPRLCSRSGAWPVRSRGLKEPLS